MNKKYYIHISILVLVIIASFAAIMFLDPISQDLSFHNFADKRTLIGIPNFFDVTTNLFFAIFGIMGFYFCFRNKEIDAPWSWIVFFLGVTLVSFGSGYYHWEPNNTTLVWDRLPMTVGFMGLFIALLSEYVKSGIERYLLIPAVLLGLFSVVYWHNVDDLRLYIWVQMIPLLTIPVAILLFKGKYTFQKFLVYALVFYLLAKVTEIYDKEIFSFTYQQLSGHSLKHILASIGPLYLYFMIKKRSPAL